MVNNMQIIKYTAFRGMLVIKFQSNTTIIKQLKTVVKELR